MERNISYLDPGHITKISETYRDWNEIESFSKVVNLEEIVSNEHSLSIILYVDSREFTESFTSQDTSELISEWLQMSASLQDSIKNLLEEVEESILI
jgi:type I restriction enzyme M protein